MNERKKELATKPIGKLLFKYAMPATIGMMVNSLYNLVDAIFIGQGAGALALGGLAVSFPIQMVFLAIATAVGIGSGSLASRALGAGDDRTADRAVGTSMATIGIISLLTTIFGLIFLDPLLKIFGATEGIIGYARDYMSIIIVGSFFYSFVVSTNNLIRAEGNARVAMISMIIGTGLNLVLDPIFIFGLGWGIRGAAVATVISIICAFIYMVHYFVTGKSMFKFTVKDIKLDFQLLPEIFSIGSSSLARMLSGSLLAIVLNNSVGFYGDDIHLAAVGAVNRLLIFLFLPIIGLVQGFLPIAGFNYGAKNYARVKRSLGVASTVASLYSLGIFLTIFFFSRPLITMFSNDTALITEGSHMLRIITIFIMFVGFQVIGASLPQAMGKAGQALLLNSSRQLLFLVPLLLILPTIYGLEGVWYAYPVADFLATSLTATVIFFQVKRFDKLHEEENREQETAVPIEPTSFSAE